MNSGQEVIRDRLSLQTESVILSPVGSIGLFIATCSALGHGTRRRRLLSVSLSFPAASVFFSVLKPFGTHYPAPSPLNQCSERL